VLYFAGRIAWGLVETRTLARCATRLTLTGDTALRCSQYCQRLGITAPLPEIAASPRVIGPITVGFRRGLLLLPPAVLAHELAHIQRRDFAKNVLYGLVSLPAVWHPLLWRTRARIAESRELVCDAVAADAITAEAVAGRKQYAQSLLRLASMLACRPTTPTLHALGILSFNKDRNALERRIMTLTHKRTPMSTTRRFVIAAACGIIALATCTSALALHTDISALSPAGESAVPAPLHVKANVVASQKISGENPTYPQEARAKKIQGTVELALVIDKDGLPQGIHVKQSPSELLTKSAIKAVSTWRWRPYLLNGDPIEVDTTVNVTYNLAG
jgi:TonB family protein